MKKTNLLIFCLFLFLLNLQKKQNVFAQTTDIILAVDLSGTMVQSDPGGLRYLGADQFFSVMNAEPGNKAGIVTIGEKDEVLLPLNTVSFEMAGVYNRLLQSQTVKAWTEIGLGLDRCRVLLEQSTSTNKAIILISDGKIEGNPDTRKSNPDAASKQADQELWMNIIPAIQRAGIKVYTIGLIQKDNKGEDLLRRVSVSTGGFYQRVDHPEQFWNIYVSIIKTALSTANDEFINSSKSNFGISKFDDAIVIKAPAGFSLRGPKGIFYNENSTSGNSPVKSNWIKSQDSVFLVFLFKPKDFYNDSLFWRGNWHFDNLRDSAQIFYFSPIHLKFDVSLREKYFVNQYFPINLKINLSPNQSFDLTKNSSFSNCKCTYTIISDDNNQVSPIHDTLYPDKNSNVANYSKDVLLNKPGTYTIAFELIDCDIFKKEQVRFNVSPDSVFWIEIKPEKLNYKIRDEFQIIGRQNFNIFKANQSNIRGLRSKHLNLIIKYENGDRADTSNITLQDNEIMMTLNKKFENSGRVEITAILTGDLVMQDRKTGELYYEPSKFQSCRIVNIQQGNRYIEFMHKIFIEHGPAAIISALIVHLILHLTLTFFSSFAKKRLFQTRVQNPELGTLYPPNWMNKTTLEKFIRSNEYESNYSIGGLNTDADIKILNMKDEIFARIGKKIFSKQSYIIRIGDTPIRISSFTKELKRNVKYNIDNNTDITIGNIKFKFKDYKNE